MAYDLGYFGPHSVTWRLHADPVLWIGGLRALFLQALHPLAMAGVEQHSGFRSDPWGRLFRTADYVGAVTYGTRAEADRASAALTAQHAADEAPEPEVTAEEWLALHDEAMRDEDPHREITDLADEHVDEMGEAKPVEDIRDVAAAEPASIDEDVLRVPAGEEMADSVRRAQRALAEIRARDVADAEREVDDSRVDQLARWHEDDQADEGLDDAAELEDAPW